jgi:peptidoglycan-associated lipoprotein
MQISTHKVAFTIALLVVVAAPGCRRAPQTRDDTTPLAVSTNTDDEDAARRRAASSIRTDRDDDDAMRDCGLNSVYFAYDRSTLDNAAQTRLQSNAACIRARRPSKVAVTGMCDPVGTTEYNFALGDRRAQTAVTYMGALGVDRSVMSPRSVGEEYAEGTNEEGWAQDRRAEFEIEPASH